MLVKQIIAKFAFKSIFLKGTLMVVSRYYSLVCFYFKVVLKHYFKVDFIKTNTCKLVKVYNLNFFLERYKPLKQVQPKKMYKYILTKNFVRKD